MAEKLIKKLQMELFLELNGIHVVTDSDEMDKNLVYDELVAKWEREHCAAVKGERVWELINLCDSKGNFQLHGERVRAESVSYCNHSEAGVMDYIIPFEKFQENGRPKFLKIRRTDRVYPVISDEERQRERQRLFDEAAGYMGL